MYYEEDNSEVYRDYLIELWEPLSENPFEGWTKEEYEAFMFKFNEECEACNTNCK